MMPTTEAMIADVQDDKGDAGMGGMGMNLNFRDASATLATNCDLVAKPAKDMTRYHYAVSIL